MDIIQGYLTLIDQYANHPQIGFLIQNKIIYTIAIFIAFFIFAYVLKFILRHIIPRFTEKTKTKIDDLIIERTQKPGMYLIMILGLYIALLPLGLSESISGVVNKILLSLAIICIILIGVRIIDTLIDIWGTEWAQKTESTIDDALLPLFHKTSKALFAIFGIIFILKVWGFNVGGLLAGVGIAGMVLGLALKDSLANIFGGVSMVLDKSLKVGDKVKIGNDVGTIQDIGLRSTKLRTYDNELLTIPNGNLANATIVNYVTPDESHRAKVLFSVGYGSDPEKIKKIVMKTITKPPIEEAVYDEYQEPNVVFTEMGDSGLMFTALLWSTWTKSYGVKLEMTKRIYKALNKYGIEIPFPTRTVYMHNVKPKRRRKK
ncbi:MAG: mechanosensitive ion channel family protein [Nanoarchaeota archaeon]|nr:mechanosensitive ion channel family protein [Nanoarchaeota archaeon]